MPNSRRIPKESDTRTVLSVSPDKADHKTLKEMLQPSAWTIFEAGCASAAHDRLVRNDIGVVLCERDLGPQTWIDMLNPLLELEKAPPLIVTSRLADDCLWAEALNRGAYDVLAKPFDRQELLRTTNLAWLRWYHAHDVGNTRLRMAVAS